LSGSPRTNASVRPSGDQLGTAANPSPLTRVTLRPSASAMYTARSPSRSESNAMRSPSGDGRTWKFRARSLTMLVTRSTAPRLSVSARISALRPFDSA
jgi:hypothetical protein